MKGLDVKEIAEKIDFHQQNGIEMGKITNDYPELTVEEAYEIQKLTIQKYMERNDPLIGWKMGLTSKAKQISMNVEEPIYGRLTESMELNEPVLHVKNLIHPKVEPEFAFIINKELKGGNVKPRDVWAAAEGVYLALEVIDSRYENFKFTLPDVVADNASSTKFVLGSQVFSPAYTLWDKVKVTMIKNGEKVQSGYGNAVLDHPVHSVVELTKMLNRDNLIVKPGMVVLVGGITEAVSVRAGDMLKVDYEGLDSLDLEVKE
ncbi:2-keto-4-pentenoate hydratase [Alteribacillus sp. YIM 98480]|uniref:2-keto-4-pentenoate hydratase n=1 Tax=Alteribacillus sp. YIM 98480 TaxID=2606599 RepID=UPI001E4DD4FF|nr:fumarylacetoacetate hydrolase family protein [Alteribacillus sp. YIM 98480]